jgi:hypothetical protein
MKIPRTFKLSRGLFAAASSLALLAPTLRAAPFAYNDGDVILAFRQPGGPAPDLVVNLGSATTFDAVPIGSTIVVANLDASQLSAAFASLNSINWAIFGAARTPGTAYPQFTIWASASRTDPNVLSSPWFRKISYGQAIPAGQIASVGQNAQTYGGNNPAGPNNTLTGVIIPFTDPNSYSALVVDPYNPNVADFGNTFGPGYGSGSVENTTPADFTTTEPLSRSDFYELIPGSQAISKLVGHFDLTPDGRLTFTAGASPTITAVHRNPAAGVTTVSFTTINSPIIYSLLYTNALGLSTSSSNWAAAPGTVTGNGYVQSLSVTNADDNAFYRVTVH